MMRHTSREFWSKLHIEPRTERYSTLWIENNIFFTREIILSLLLSACRAVLSTLECHKETYTDGKRDLDIWQKRPADMQKRPTCVIKRDLRSASSTWSPCICSTLPVMFETTAAYVTYVYDDVTYVTYVYDDVTCHVRDHCRICDIRV